MKIDIKTCKVCSKIYVRQTGMIQSDIDICSGCYVKVAAIIYGVIQQFGLVDEQVKEMKE